MTTFFLVNTSSSVKKNVKNPSGTTGLATPALPAGQSITPAVAAFSVYGDTLAGTYVLQACADGPKGVAEAIETNNCANSVGTIPIDQAPNLVVTSIGNPTATAPLGTVIKVTNGVKNTGQAQAGRRLVVTDVTVKNAPLTVARGGSLIITSTVKNVGEGDAVASTTKFLLVNAAATQNLNGTLSVPLLRGNATYTAAKTVTVLNVTPVGTYAPRVCADSLDVVAEVSETNCVDTGAIVTVQ